MHIKLYSRYRNSAGQRVRIALNLKNISYEYIAVPLDGGVPESYRNEVNPQGLLPSLALDDKIITQSTAQIEFIEENFKGPSLYPEDPILRAHSRAFSQIIACEIHPVIGPKIQRYLINRHKFDNKEILNWYQKWMYHGFDALEELLSKRDKPMLYCYDDKPTVADIYLVPQLINARLVDMNLEKYSELLRIDKLCQTQLEFQQSMPENQPDYPGTGNVNLNFAEKSVLSIKGHNFILGYTRL